MLLEGIFGTGCGSLGLLDAAAGVVCVSAMPVPGRRGLLGEDWEAGSAPTVGSGGGNGEIDMDVTDAAWA